MLNSKAPNFNLPDIIDDLDITLDGYAPDAPVVLAFICNHCPFVNHIIDHFVSLANEYQKQGVRFIAISPNDANNYPEDAPDKMRAFAELYHFSFPYCYDETQAVAQSYQAICTPEFYVLDRQHHLVYHGRFDDSRPSSRTPVTGSDLRTALDCVLSNTPVPEKQIPSLGCVIKWKNA